MDLQTCMKGLNLGVTNAATSGPCSLHRESITEDPYTSLANHQRGLGPFFSMLPRELRDQIYSELIASGHVHFLRASRAMNEEGMPWIFKKGIYRFNYRINMFNILGADADHINCPPPASKIEDNIQNLGIQIRWSHGNSDGLLYHIPEAISWIERFKGSHATHRKCTVTVQVYPWFDPQTLLSEIADSMKEFSCFGAVGFCFRDDPDYKKFIDAHFSQASIMTVRRVDYAEMETYLRQYLGNGEVSSDGDGLVLLFRPGKVQRQNAARGTWILMLTSIKTDLVQF